MKLNPVTESPKQLEGHTTTDLLIIQTSDGLVQTGYANFFQGSVHSWTIVRDGGFRNPCMVGTNYNIGCFPGLKITGLAYMPNVADIMMAM